MVARLFALRLALLLAPLRSGARAAARAIGIGLCAAIAAISYARLPDWLAVDAASRQALDGSLAAILLGTITIAPSCLGAAKIEPRQFAALPQSPTAIATAIYLSTVCTWGTGWLLLWLVTLVTLRPEWLAVPGWMVIACCLTLLITLASVRVCSALVQLVASRHTVVRARMIATALLSVAAPTLVCVVAAAARSPEAPFAHATTAALGWAPTSAPIAALTLAAQGNHASAVAHLAVACVSLIALIALWYVLVARACTSIERPDPHQATRANLDLFGHLPTGRGSVVAARLLTYWRRDPRYQVMLLAIPAAPVAVFVVLLFAGVDASMLTLLPLPIVLLLLGWATHNDVAFDSTAIWLHVASGISGFHDRLGRLIPVLCLGLPLIALGSSITVAVADSWQLLPAFAGMNLAVLLAAVGTSMVFSALAPYPATRPGDSPFAQPVIPGSNAGLTQTLSMLASLTLASPAVLAFLFGLTEPSAGVHLIIFCACSLWGLIVLGFCLMIGARLFQRKAPELLALNQTFD